MLHTTPFLLFDGNCAEAMTFYHKCLGGVLTLTKLGDTPMKDQFPVEKHERLINAHLENGAIEISATDWMASPSFEPKQGNTFAIFVTGGKYNELTVVFDKLAEGAEEEKKRDFSSCMICHSERMDNFTTDMVSNGFSGVIKRVIMLPLPKQKRKGYMLG